MYVYEQDESTRFIAKNEGFNRFPEKTPNPWPRDLVTVDSELSRGFHARG